MIRAIGRFLGIAGQAETVEPSGFSPPVLAQAAARRAWTMLAGYDAAHSDGANAKHWTDADGSASWSANSPGVRETLRNRTRHEVANNSLAAGIVATLADDTIGTGPYLSVEAGDREANQRIERAFAEWANETGFVEKLRTMRRSKAADGEAFAILGTNPRLGFVQLDLRLIEADQVATPDLSAADPSRIDGVHLDRFGDPKGYDVLRVHPGDDRALGNSLTYDTIAAESVVHIAHRTRPGEIRGVPELTPALGLFALLRRYTLASILSAEIAAKLSGVLESQTPEGDVADLPPMDAVEIDPGTIAAMPEGWRLAAFKGEQPTTTFGEFRRHIVNEIGRCLNMPANIAIGSSENMNFSSGRLDHGVYQQSLRVERTRFERLVLDRVFAAWIREAVLVDPGLAPGISIREIRHAWRWPAFASGDPVKDANADKIYRELGVLSLERLYSSRFGSEWDRELEQIRREQEFAREIGVEAPSTPPANEFGQPDREAAGAGVGDSRGPGSEADE
jgi:capsid protein